MLAVHHHLMNFLAAKGPAAAKAEQLALRVQAVWLVCTHLQLKQLLLEHPWGDAASVAHALGGLGGAVRTTSHCW